MIKNINASALVLDDHVITRQACCELLRKEQITIVWEGEDALEAYEGYISLKPTIAIIDISLKGMSGLETIRLIKDHDIDAKIIVFSMHTDSIVISHALELGALSYLSKTSSPEEFSSAVKLALSGKAFISKELNSMTDKTTRTLKDVISSLTSQQQKIFRLIVSGNSITSISKELDISTKSVSVHLDKIKDKLGAKSISDLVRIAIILDSPMTKTES